MEEAVCDGIAQANELSLLPLLCIAVAIAGFITILYRMYEGLKARQAGNRLFILHFIMLR